MKKFMCFTAAVLLLMTGCAQTTGQNGEVVQTEMTTGEITTAEVETDAFGGFRTGKWKCENDGSVKYYYFDGDGKSGRFLDPETNMGLGFEYELDGENAVFHMGAADDVSPAVIKQIDDNCVEINWENGETELLTYIGNESEQETAVN